jgi:protein-L-isoaspartate(D-aspartate) O-methyltransferase
MAALLGRQAAKVVSLEIHPELVELAKGNLKREGIENVEVICADGSSYRHGDAPFDVIVLSGSVAEVPAFLLTQLKPTGRLMAIVGQSPMMRAHLVKCDAVGRSVTQAWDTVAPRLQGFAEPSRFVF